MKLKVKATAFKLFKFIGYSMIFTILAIFVSANVSFVYAQKNKPTKKGVSKKGKPVKVEIVESLSQICIPPENDFFVSVLQIDKNSNLTLTKQTNESSTVLFNNVPISSVDKVLSGIDKKSVLTFEADPALNYEIVTKTLLDIRRKTGICANVKASAEIYSQYVYFPRESIAKNTEVKPNPLFLLVELDKNMNLTLNNEPQGTLKDTAQLSNFLKQIFQERSDYGAFREGTNEIETTVYIKAPSSSKFSDVIKIADALKEAGASLIVLQIDEIPEPPPVPLPPSRRKTI